MKDIRKDINSKLKSIEGLLLVVYNMKYLTNLMDLFISTILMILYYPFYPKNIWIISEREMQAQDNGIAFFKYINSVNKDISIYYLIHKDSKDLNKVKTIGNVLIIGSIKHKLFFLKSKVVASTEKNVIEPWGSNIFYNYFGFLYPKKIRIFLQHGIIDKDVSHIYGKNVSNFDLFVTSSEEERKFVIDNFGYDKEEVICTGLARYDLLISQNLKENYILYMPTWRRNLVNPEEKDINNISEMKREFSKSNYYFNIMNLLNDKKLECLLDKYNFKLIFITHHTLDCFNDLFTTKIKNIIVRKQEDINIKDLLIKSKILITDYSSIHFDSAYLGNVNFYYQFDRENFLKNHAGESYFSYKNQGFGYVTDNKDNLLEKIERVINDNCRRDKIYSDRLNKFIKFKDQKNSQRIYEAIINYKNKT